MSEEKEVKPTPHDKPVKPTGIDPVMVQQQIGILAQQKQQAESELLQLEKALDEKAANIHRLDGAIGGFQMLLQAHAQNRQSEGDGQQ